MGEWLEHLGRDTLPAEVVQEFVQWCVWSQARPALLQVLEKLQWSDVATAIQQADDLSALDRYNNEMNQRIKQLRASTGPLMLSAAEAATFEFTNLLAAASEQQGDAEDVAFFAARVCGWAAWATTDFSDSNQKNIAEKNARQEQEVHLALLWQHYNA